MATLYELANNYQQLLEYAENEEIDIELLVDTLESIEDEAEIKFENISKLIKHLNGEVEKFKTEEKRLYNRRKSMESKTVRLKGYMLESLDIMKKDKVNAGLFTIAKQKNPTSVEVLSLDKLPESYKIQQEPKVDKKTLLKDLKEGKKIEGAVIASESYHVRIR